MSRDGSASPPSSMRMGYRPGLDGVRGLAIVLVLLFHAHVPGFANGAIGVDVFFALSGFLITTLLIEELSRSSRLRFARFYTRRASRLLPAYLLLGVTCVVLAVVIADRSTFRAGPRSVRSTPP